MKKSAVLFFISLIILCASASAVSVAWFASSDFLRINSFEITVNASDDLQISLEENASEYVDEITQEMEKGDYLIPVSSMFSSTWMKQKPKDPIFYSHADRNYNEFVTKDSVKYVNPKASQTYSGYYSDEFYLKSSTPKVAYLDTSDLKTFVVPDKVSNEARADSLIASGDSTGKAELVEKLNNLKNSLRISILVDSEEGYDYKIFDPYKDEDTLYGGPVDSECKGMYDVKSDGQANYEVLYGEVENREKIVYSYNENLNRKNYPTWIDSGHYANTNTIDLQQSIQNGVNIAKEKSITFEENAANINNLMNSLEADEDKMVLIPLATNVPTRIVISVYMEGWDKDNIDSTMGASFNAQLTFGILDRHII